VKGTPPAAPAPAVAATPAPAPVTPSPAPTQGTPGRHQHQQQQQQRQAGADPHALLGHWETDPAAPGQVKLCITVPRSGPGVKITQYWFTGNEYNPVSANSADGAYSATFNAQGKGVFTKTNADTEKDNPNIPLNLAYTLEGDTLTVTV